MSRNITTGQLVLIAIAAAILLLAGFSFYLLQNPSAWLPFAPLLATSTSTATSTAQISLVAPSSTPLPTRQTSYTPFSTLLTQATSASPSAGTTTITPQGSITASPGSLTQTVTPSGSTARPTYTPSVTPAPTTPLISLTPSKTPTSYPGEDVVTGRMVQNGTPVANVVVEFKDDVAPRQASTNSTGHYRFTTLAPGTSFSLTFKQSSNPQLTPAAEITSLALIIGNLPIGMNTITIPDFEISINTDEGIFETLAPMDGGTYSAALISSANRIQFVWSLYNQGSSYRVELGLHDSDQVLWTSNSTTLTTVTWDGTLGDGSHITQGSYWWRVSATNPLANYTVIIYTQAWDILFNP